MSCLSLIIHLLAPGVYSPFFMTWMLWMHDPECVRCVALFLSSFKLACMRHILFPVNSLVHSKSTFLYFVFLLMRRNEWANIMMLNSHVDHVACLFSLSCVVLTSTLSYVSINKWTFIFNHSEMLTQPASILCRRRRLTRLSQQLWQVSLWKGGSSSFSCVPCPLFSLWSSCTHIGWSTLSSSFSSLFDFLSHAF